MMRYYYITDSKADIDNFKNKFGTDDKGRDIYSLFIKYKDRLKNHGISNDITYHTKHTSKEEMLDILYRMDNQSYENEKGERSIKTTIGKSMRIIIGVFLSPLIGKPLWLLETVLLGV